MSQLQKPPPVVSIIKSFLKVYDFLTYPIYTVIQKPGEKLARHNAVKAKRHDTIPNAWTSILPRCPKSQEIQDSQLNTLERLFDYSMKKYKDKPCLGTRPLLAQTLVQDPRLGQIMKKKLGDYEWKTYSQVEKISNNLCRSLVQDLGLGSKSTIAIFADTREEWLMTAIAAFKANISIATVFTTLADEGVVQALTETEVDCLFTTEDLLPRCYILLKQTPKIKRVIYMERPNNPTKLELDKLPPSIQVIQWNNLVQQGEKLSSTPMPELTRPTPDDTAIIMYTSGSTGVPKGVILTHKNATSVLGGMADALYSVNKNDLDNEAYLAFLPLAHILELTSEANSLLHGAKIGYGTPLTLTDAAIGLQEGTRGDAMLGPSCIAVVPLVLERVSKSVYGKLDAAGGSLRGIFDFFCDYKMSWLRRGYETPILDRIFFSKMKQVLGGKINLIICGGAHLAEQTEDLIKTILSTQVLVGYGLTETTGCASCCLTPNLSVGRVGSPSIGMTLRLVDWEEGGYTVKDSPYPRGELWVTGPIVAKGYFKREGSTDFFEEDGRRWFKTGDIAEVHPDGCFRIIDRKKDLVKLATGEFLSLGKIESILKTSEFVENVCVYGNSSLSRPIAIIVPGQAPVTTLAKKLGKGDKDFKDLTEDPEIVDEVLKEIQGHSRHHLLSKMETIAALHLSPESWMPQSGLVTASLKLKRTNIHTKFKPQIEILTKKILNTKS